MCIRDRITGSTISNNGAVVGKENVGGVFGSNSSTIKTSSIYNSTEGMVIGINNVGGLIGINTGTIAVSYTHLRQLCPA